MEKQAIRIVSQSAMTANDWTNPRTNEVVTIRSKELVMSDGIDTFVCEATDQLAENLERQPLADGTVVNAAFAMNVRSWTSQKGQEVKSTNIRLLKIAAV